MDISYPQLASIVVVGCAHFVEDQARLSGGEPQMVVRSAPIAQMIVNACATATFLLFVVRKASEIAIVVVSPHKGNIVRHL